MSAEDLSPELGGDRARGPEPVEEAPAEAPVAEAPADAFFGSAALGFVATLEAFGRNFESLVSSTVESLEQQLPEALAAIDQLFEAVEAAIGPMPDEPPPPTP